MLLQHFTGALDNWDPAVTDALALGRSAILFESSGIGRSSGKVPVTVAGMADHAMKFLDALGLTHVDVLGFSLGGMVAQVMARVVKQDKELRDRPLEAVLAALVHDAGMLQVPAEILVQTDALTDDEAERGQPAHARGERQARRPQHRLGDVVVAGPWPFSIVRMLNAQAR